MNLDNKKNLHCTQSDIHLSGCLSEEGAVVRLLLLLFILHPLGQADIVLHKLVLLHISAVILLN